MSRLNPDGVDMVRELRRRVAALERGQRSYMETVIVLGEFFAATSIPPFFTPFGGQVVSVMARTESGNADISLWRGLPFSGLFITDVNIADGGGIEQVELDPPIYLDEGDFVTVDVLGTDSPSVGLSVGVIIQP